MSYNLPEKEVKVIHISFKGALLEELKARALKDDERDLSYWLQNQLYTLWEVGKNQSRFCKNCSKPISIERKRYCSDSCKTAFCDRKKKEVKLK